MIAASNACIVLLPGMGADARLFAKQREAFPTIVVPDWLPPRRKERLRDYAERFASALVVSRPLVLGGSSFGGMVACELAAVLRPNALVLLGSTADPLRIPFMLRALAPVGGLLPERCHTAMGRLANRMAGAFGAASESDRELFVKMAQSTPSSFTRWACTAIAAWKAPNLSGIPVFAVHGTDDRILPPDRAMTQTLVPGAGHLLPMTHPESVNRFLADVLRVVGSA